MAYRRSITSSDDDSTGPKFTKERSDSSESAQLGTSAKYRWMWDYSSPYRGRGAETPSPMGSPESSDEDKENEDPALLELESEEEEDPSEYPVYLDPPEPIEISDDSEDSLVEIIQMAAQSSYTGPPGFEPGSSAAADMQHHLNFAHRRIEQLEDEMGHREYAHEEVRAGNIELADCVAHVSTAFVMMGIGRDVADRANGSLWVAVVVLVLMVVALLVRGWM